MDFYGRDGSAVAYLSEEGTIFTFSGKPVAYLVGNSIYAFSGRFLGWLENGWLYDRDNRPSLFSQSAQGGPLKPLRALKPLKGLRELKPLRGSRELKPLKPLRSIDWGSRSDAAFFETS